MAPSAPPINHLLFAYDNLLFVKASTEGTNELSSLLESYCNASGQKVNLSKSSIFFIKGCPQSLKLEAKEALHVPNESLSERYLGMPTDVGNSKNGAFKFLKDRVWNKVNGWMEKIMFVGGKEVLIKSIAQAVPVYSMSYFKLPRGLCEHIITPIQMFWWGSTEGRRKPNWVSWSVMTRPKSCGGFGLEILNSLTLPC